ncbi:hypothetical protein SO802_015278 [Lithocarpus litseifolius]|uniref:Uncharacterized protein n=1 Tax=Lithocarpus litseifolius TaxID=425828 RepID=A0AAW2CTU2_9ROSI
MAHKNDFRVRDAGNNHLLFTFELEFDVEKVLIREPLSFDRHLVVLQRYDEISPMEEVDLSKSMFCIQIHNLPLSWLTPDVAMEIGDSLGESMRPVSGSVAETKTSGSTDIVKVMELSPKEVEKLSGRLEVLGEQFQQGTTEIVEAKNKEVLVMDFEKKLQDVDKALTVDYVYSNLNSSGLESVKDDSGNLSASITHVTLVHRELRYTLALKGKGDMININGLFGSLEREESRGE